MNPLVGFVAGPAFLRRRPRRPLRPIAFWGRCLRRPPGAGFFWSRTRGKLWMKGETSGNRLRVIEASTDCDNDALLFRVEVEGDGLVCHEGTVSCFTKPIVKGTK